MEEKLTFPEYLKQLRKSHNYKQHFVAAQLHISRQNYSHYETGRVSPSVTVLYHLAKLYGTTVEDMLEHMEVSLGQAKEK